MKQQLKAVALVNLAAYEVRKLGRETVQKQVSETFEKYGIDAEPVFLIGSEIGPAAMQALESIQRNEIDAIIAGGGDGTMNTVAAVLAGADVPLGVLPLGTLNHFAKDLGIPMSLAGAVAIIAENRAVPVDVAEVNTNIFINNSSIGIYPYIVLDRDRIMRRRRQSKWIALALALIRIARRFPVHRLLVSAAGQAKSYRTPCLFVGNDAYRLGIDAFGRRQRLDEGLLDVYVAKPSRPLSLFLLACRALLGFLDEKELDHWQVRSADVLSRKHRLLVALDGEVRVMHSPLHYRSRAKALRVYVAKDFEGR
jgi:diacylglycerol kinase family enzyme